MKFPTPDISDYRGFTITLDPIKDDLWREAYQASFTPALLPPLIGRRKRVLLRQAKGEIDFYLSNRPG